MPLFTKESLETLRDRIDLVEVLEPHLEMKKAGAVYKALCPFHDEKSPSFMVKRGDSHYHCFGCGAHGDAIAFLMEYQHLPFVEAVEVLAEKFHVPLEMSEKKEKGGISKSEMAAALECASRFYQAYLLHTDEGHLALNYLFERKITLEFIRRFGLGFAPEDGSVFRKVMETKGFSDPVLLASGLLTKEKGLAFFRSRITFPIKKASGAIIGFSARKIKEEVFGGKYINTTETALFKKSKVLFGLDLSRRRIVKERKAILVEGQVDALKLINAGLDYSVSALGTAFTESHVQELKVLGVRQVILLFDGDQAGTKAAFKTGDLFQSVGIEVNVVTLPQGTDPDSYINRYGIEALEVELSRGVDYLSFAVRSLSQELNGHTPAGKNALASTLKEQVKKWEEPIMVHESLRTISKLLNVPEDVMGVGSNESMPYQFKTDRHIAFGAIDPNRILELDCLRPLALQGDKRINLMGMALKYLTPEHFVVPICRKVFEALSESHAQEKKDDLLSLFISIDAEQAAPLIEELLQKKTNPEKIERNFKETVQKLLDRSWMHKRELIKQQIHSGQHSEEEVLALAKEFDALQKERPHVE